MTGFMPPNGYAGFAQQTPAVQALFRPSGARRARRKGRRAAAARAAPKRRRAASSGKTRRGGKLKRLVKGSAAAKRYMAKIRRMRKR